MRKIVMAMLSLLAVACSSEIDEVTLDEINKEVALEEASKEETPKDTPNNAPVFETQSFTITEHSTEGSTIGFLSATDEDEDDITYTLKSTIGIDLNENTGELKVGTDLNLDFETGENLQFTVFAFDGKTTTEKTFDLSIEDVDEVSLLTNDQKELIAYFQQLTYWKTMGKNPKAFNQKWGSEMKLHLKGNISAAFKSTVESVISQYNTLMVKGDFNISLVEDENEANAFLFFGSKPDVETIWPDMYERIKDGSYDGFAMTPSENSVLVSTRIWVSNPIEVLFKHELGHALGFGHSNKCDDEHSFLCSQISVKNDFLPVEEDIIRLMYHSDVPAGLSEIEIEKLLADLMLNEQ